MYAKWLASYRATVKLFFLFWGPGLSSPQTHAAFVGIVLEKPGIVKMIIVIKSPGLFVYFKLCD